MFSLGRRRAAPLPITLRSVATCSALQPRAPPGPAPSPRAREQGSGLPPRTVGRGVGARRRAAAAHSGWGPRSLLHGLLLPLEAEACAPVQFPLFLRKVVSAGSACSGFQDVVNLQHDFVDRSSVRFEVEVFVVMIA